MQPMVDDPVLNIEWRDADSLEGNDYNPNRVFNKELRLLEFSILRQGWVQPVLINSDGVIIDGFHRVMISRESAKLKKLYNGRVPCCVLPIERPEAMMLTIRINRAKGAHAGVRMAEIVKELIDTHGLDRAHIATEIGAPASEIDLLYQEGVFSAKNIKDYRYSNAWYPAEEKKAAG